MSVWGCAMSEQLSFLAPVPFCPLMPNRNTAAEQALSVLMERDITQIDWSEINGSWRLSAVIKDLDYLGWEPSSIRVKPDGCNKHIALYSLPEKAKQALYAMRNQGGAHD